ncbi:MAG: hypothetical protein ABF535_12660, partial [Acetobacter sp.]
MTGKERRSFQLFSGKILPAVLLLIFCFAVRLQSLGNPLIDLDEGYYLFVGGQILQGGVPFVDIWDRKPLGLVLLYAFFHLFGPYRVLAYQIGAVTSVWCTSLLVMKMARLVGPATGAFVAALLYVGCVNMAGGEGGQSPIFYNLLVAGAMSVIMTAVIVGHENIKDMKIAAYKAMLLMGVSLQIKYTTVFEGMFAGVFLLGIFYHKMHSVRSVAVQAFLWISITLLPTATVALVYALAGYGHQWWFANIVSIFYREHAQPDSARHQAIKMLMLISPFLMALPFRKSSDPRMTPQQQACRRFIDIWVFSAFFGIVVFGTRYIHYVLPFFTPLAVAMAPLWYRKFGRIWLGALLLYVMISGQVTVMKRRHHHGDDVLFQKVVSTVSHPEGCVFVYNVSPIFYDFSHFCKITTHPFPAHLYEIDERRATGMNPLVE